MMANSLKKIWDEVHNSVVRDSDGVLINFKCRFCAKKIVRQDYFKLHLHRQHYLHLNIDAPPKNHKCSFENCGFSSYTNGELSSHIAKKHKEGKGAHQLYQEVEVQHNQQIREQIQLAPDPTRMSLINARIQLASTTIDTVNQPIISIPTVEASEYLDQQEEVNVPSEQVSKPVASYYIILPDRLTTYATLIQSSLSSILMYDFS